MKIKTTKLILSILLLAPLAQGAIVARYTFDGNVNDIVGGFNGTATTAGAFTEAPLYVTDIPAGAISGAPTKSMEVGMTNNTLKSGFVTPTAVFTPAQGGISFWMKADSLVSQDYVFTTGTTNDLFLLAAGATTVRSRANEGTTLIDATVSVDVWNHVAISWDNDIGGGNGSHKLFLNGSEVTPADGLFTAGGLSATNFRIGSFTPIDGNSSNLINQFDGHIYDFQFYDTEITVSDATFLSSNPGAVIPEPTTSTLAGLLFALGCMRRRRTA
jgi:Concanavalin A-like lectin/glucanases superfamily